MPPSNPKISQHLAKITFAKALLILLGLFLAKQIAIVSLVEVDVWGDFREYLYLIAWILGLMVLAGFRRKPAPRMGGAIAVGSILLMLAIELPFAGFLIRLHGLVAVLMLLNYAAIALLIYVLIRDRKSVAETPKLRKIQIYGFQIGAVFTILFFTECILRLAGLQTGQLYPHLNLKKVDSLVVKTDFYADENGITCVSAGGREWVRTRVQGTIPLPEKETADDTISTALYQLAHDFHEINQNPDATDFAQAMDSISQIQQPDSFGLALLSYAQNPINAQGFRSPDFYTPAQNRPKVLLLGDSFTWGWSAKNFSNSFADRLLLEGMLAFNTGVAAAGPAQYLAVAEKYIPEIQPDVVVVNLCMANDWPKSKRPLLPHQSFLYATNAGTLYRCPGGEYLESPEAAYQFMLNEYFLTENEQAWHARWAGKTILGTYLWKAGMLAGLWNREKPNADYWNRPQNQLQEKPVTAEYLREIEVLCEANDAKFMLVAIPDPSQLEMKIPEDFPDHFQGFQPLVPQMEIPDYNLGDDHFNDQGHRKYSEFLSRAIWKRLGGEEN